jgi:integrase
LANCVIAPHLGGVLLGKLSADDVEEWHNKLSASGVSADRQRKAATTLRAALNAAVKKGKLAVNVARNVAKPAAVHVEQDCWDWSQAQRFLAAAVGFRLEAYYILALDSGARPSELLALNWPDVDWQAGTIFIRRALEELKGKFKIKPPKSTAGTRVVRLTRCTMKALADHRERMQNEGREVADGLVFCDVKGGYLRKGNLQNRSFAKILKKAGLPTVRPYVTRHTSATLLLSRDVSLVAVSKRLGHENTATTLKHYGHALTSMQEKAVSVLEELMENKLSSSDSPTVVPPETKERLTKSA